MVKKWLRYVKHVSDFIDKEGEEENKKKKREEKNDYIEYVPLPTVTALRYKKDLGI